MIDLDKPIRCKYTSAETRVEECPYRIWDGRVFQHLTRAELERYYENIPEPRKPRELKCEIKHFDDGSRIYSVWMTTDTTFPFAPFRHPQITKIEIIRVIEWPDNAPLPDWPE